MPMHYAAGLNIQTGSVKFNDVKTMSITFNFPFPVVPSVSLTLEDLSNDIPIKYNVSKTGLEIKMKSKYTGGICWQAICCGGA